MAIAVGIDLGTTNKGTIYSAKRFIGRRYDEVKSEIEAVLYDVVPGPDDAARFQIRDKQYAPEEISALVLRKLVTDASKSLGEGSSLSWPESSGSGPDSALTTPRWAWCSTCSTGLTCSTGSTGSTSAFTVARGPDRDRTGAVIRVGMADGELSVSFDNPD